MRCQKRNLLSSVGLCVFLAAGCGGDSDQTAPNAQSKGNSADSVGAAASTGLPTASLGNPQHSDDLDRAVPEKGSPEWIVGEIIHLRSQPLPETEDPQQRQRDERQRFQRIIDLAGSVIAETHDRPDKQSTFDDAVHLLFEARRELALLGNTADITELYEDAAALYERDKESKAASEAAFAVVQFARANASRYAKQEPRWLSEFARQARQYANRFPRFQSRAVSLLDSAAWSCELHGLTDEAANCYAQLKQQFPDSPQAQRVDGILKRLQLKGNRLELGGETRDGGYFKIDQWHGRHVLVVIWSTKTRGIQEKLTQIQAILKNYESAGFSVVGVSLDDEPEVLESFLQQNRIAWPQLFSADPEQRSWHNPVARAYGIRDVPTLWLVDQDGIVVDTSVDLQKLGDQLSKTLTAQSP